MAAAQRINGWLRRVPPWTLYVAGAILPAWLTWLAASGSLGADPVKALERTLGLWGLKLIIAGLCVTPLRQYTGINLLRFRRAIGVVAFSYILLHFTVWLVLDLALLFDQALADIARRPYVTVGMAGLAMLVPLAATSNNYSVRRLGAARWQKLHRLVYPAALAGGIHYLWLVKSWPPEPIVYLAIIVGLLLLRLRGRRRAAPQTA